MELLRKDDGGFNYFRILSVVLIVVGILGLSTIIVYSKINKTITISDQDKQITVKTIKKNVKDILDQANIVVANEDVVTPAIGENIGESTEIVINRAKPVKLIVYGEEKNILTNRQTVQELLDEKNIKLNETDKLNVEPTQFIFSNLAIKITGYRTDTITEKEQIAFNMTERKTTSISRGTRRVVKEGKEGIKEKTYKVVYEDNNVISKELLNQKVVSKPVNGVVEVGTEPQVKVYRGEDIRYSSVVNMTATAYTAGYESTRKRPGDAGYGRTATGAIAQRGVVAVDPKVIPLGTKLFIESTDGFPSYGYAVAADTGGAIKGNKIDLFYENLSDAKSFGRRTVKVYVMQ